MNAHQIVEAILFAADAPLTADEIARADESLDEDRVEEAIDFLQAEYGDADRSFQIVELAEGYQILTRAEFAPYLERFDNVPRPSRLSGPALETLAIIAYRQPLGRVEIEYIRGVGSSGVIRTLLDRQLVDVVGRGEGLGRPLLYGTTRHFLEHFGFRSLENLPRPEELPVILRDRIPLGPPEDEAEAGEQEELPLGSGEPPAEVEGEQRDAEPMDDQDAAVEASDQGVAAEAPKDHDAAEEPKDQADPAVWQGRDAAEEPDPVDSEAAQGTDAGVDRATTAAPAAEADAASPDEDWVEDSPAALDDSGDSSAGLEPDDDDLEN